MAWLRERSADAQSLIAQYIRNKPFGQGKESEA